MGYQDCPCFKCDHGGEREKRVECRRKCTEFTAWKACRRSDRKRKKIKTNTIRRPKESFTKET